MNRMGRTLDDMRVKLKDSMEQVARYNRELEARVEKRTAEVTLLYEELKVKEQLREELLRKTISAQEEERKRIARELHDDLSQTLTAILLSLKSGAATPSRNAAEEAVVRAIDSIHRMIYDLRPSILDDLGLPAAIRSYAENRLRPLGISVRFEGDFQEERLPGQMEIALFRIAQEAISNIARHSRAEIAVISLERLPHSIRLEIEDDGEGFNIDQKEGYGLLGISERAALLGGTIEVETAPDAGTRITVQAPLAQQEVVHG